MHEPSLSHSSSQYGVENTDHMHEEAVRMLQQLRDAIQQQQRLIESYAQIQAEDERRFSARKSHGAMSRHGYEALTTDAEQHIEELETSMSWLKKVISQQKSA